MVSVRPYAYDALDAYARQLRMLEPQVEGWVQVHFDLRHTRVVLRNEYVDLGVFKWLHEHVGPQHQFVRNSKFAQGKGWAYSVTGVVEVNKPDPVHYLHTFFFENANDAMRFKLSWV